jgi:hypothetical protein
MHNISKSILISSIPELFILIDKEGRYLDYFGGADTQRYQNLENLKDKSLADFFDASLVDKFLAAICFVLENHISTTVQYEIAEAGGLKNQSYRAEISPIQGEVSDCALLSVTNVTRQVKAKERSYNISTLDFELTAPVLNRVAYRENSREFKNAHPEHSEYGLHIKNFDEIAMFADTEKLLDLENHVAATLSKRFAEIDSLIGRVSEGRFSIVALSKDLAVTSLLKQIVSDFQGKVVVARDGKTRIPVQFTWQKGGEG